MRDLLLLFSSIVLYFVCNPHSPTHNLISIKDTDSLWLTFPLPTPYIVLTHKKIHINPSMFQSLPLRSKFYTHKSDYTTLKHNWSLRTVYIAPNSITLTAFYIKIRIFGECDMTFQNIRRRISVLLKPSCKEETLRVATVIGIQRRQNVH